MAIIAKNIIIGGKVEEKIAPPPKPVTVSTFEQIKTVNPVGQKQVIEEPKEHYKHVHHGDLHRLFNTKSTYLKDMAGLDN